MPGAVLGAYRVLNRIGEGGMGAVNIAEHTLLGRKAAIKALLLEVWPTGELFSASSTKLERSPRSPTVVQSVIDAAVLDAAVVDTAPVDASRTKVPAKKKRTTGRKQNVSPGSVDRSD
jgi:serine/threonine protein kinase